VVLFGGFFPKLEFSRGFLYVCIIYISGSISAAAMAWDIIFFRLAGPVGDYTWAHTVIFRLQGCDGWGEGRGIFYIKASVVQWKDIRPWQLDLFF
jgi:hypothetical protein